MAKCKVITPEPIPTEVQLTLTIEEAQALHSLLGDSSHLDLQKFMKCGDAKYLNGPDGETTLFDILDNELHQYSNTFKGTVGR